MKRKLLLFVGLIFLGIALQAAPVKKDQAQVVAVNVYKAYAPASITNYTIENIQEKISDSQVMYFVFNFKDGGFVITSADDAIVPVLAYSFESKFDIDKLNANVAYWMNSYENEIKEVLNNKLDNTVTQDMWQQWTDGNAKISGKDVNPLLTTTWDQGGYYNDLCPGNSMTGCVATAMAQVMNYHEYPAMGAGWHTYDHPTQGTQTAMFFETTYDWASMPNAVTSPNTAVATLMYHCGVSVSMDYSPSASGAFSNDAAIAFANYFKYAQTLNYVEKADYTNTDWINLLKAELDASRPVYYSGSDASQGGHAWVCDGYNASDQMHMNWGWGGYQNGYFTMGSLNPSGYAFNNDNAAIIGVEPANGNEEFYFVKKYTDFSELSAYPDYIHAVNENICWATAADGSGGGANFKLFTKTTDGGSTWTGGQITGANTGDAFSMVFGLDAQTAFIAAWGTGTNNHIFKTTDGGATWTSKLQGTSSTSFFNVVHFFNATEGFAQGDPDTEFEIYTTADAGETWTRVNGANIPNPISGEFGIVGHYTAVGDVAWFTTNKGRVYKSLDKGATWSAYTIYSGSSQTYIHIAFDDGALNGLAHVSLTNGSSITGYQYYKSTDGGETWTQITPVGNFYDSGISSIPGESNTFVSVGADFDTPKMGASISTDGGTTWNEIADYYQAHQMLSVDFLSMEKGFVGSFQDDYMDGIFVFGELGVQEFYTVTFTVTDTAGIAIEGADISINSDILTTDANGVATIDLTDGTYPFTVTADGYLTHSGNVTVAGAAVDADVVLETDGILNIEKSKVKLYPSLAQSYVNIDNAKDANLVIYNLIGKKVLTIDNIASNKQLLDIESLENGVYLVRIEKSKKVSTFKLTVVK